MSELLSKLNSRWPPQETLATQKDYNSASYKDNELNFGVVVVPVDQQYPQLQRIRPLFIVQELWHYCSCLSQHSHLAKYLISLWTDFSKTSRKYSLAVRLKLFKV